MKKTKGPGATPKPSQSRKGDSNTWRRIYTRDNGELSLDAVYVLRMFDTIDDAPLDKDEKAVLKVLVRFANPNGAQVEWHPIAWPDEARLVRKSGVGRTTLICRVLPTLAELDYIERCYRTRSGELTTAKRDRNGQWNGCGYVLHLETLEALAELSTDERLEHQRVTLAKRAKERPRRAAPRSHRENGPCSESPPSRVHTADAGLVHTANTIELTPPNLENEPYRDRNATTIATASPTNTEQNQIIPSTDGERSDPERRPEETYIAPCSPRELGTGTADTGITFTPEQSAIIAGMKATMRRKQEDEAAMRAAAQPERKAPIVPGSADEM